MDNNLKAVIGWGIAAVIVGFVMTFKNNSPDLLVASTFIKILGALSGTFFGFIGAMMGDAIRRFTQPDAFFTSGGMGSILKTKLFWMVGPQCIGLVIGAAIGLALVIQGSTA